MDSMRVYILPMLCLALCCELALSTSQANTKEMTRKQSQALFEQNENYAIIVGINQYEYTSNLNYAVADAERLAGLFSGQGYEVKLLKNHEANREVILNRVRHYAALATNNGETDGGNLVFAFSGHGFRDGAGRNYLATSLSKKEDLAGTALAVAEIKQALKNSGVRQRVLFIDACRNDPSKNVSSENQTFSRDPDAEGLAVLFSTGADTLSWEDANLQQGVFSYFLAQGLEGDAADESGLLTFHGLTRYVQQKVKRYVSKRYNETQIPYITGERTGEFVVGKTDQAVVPEPEPPVEPEPTTGRLTVKVEPPQARIRIMNIAPVYHAGIELEKGRQYDVLVTHEGYQPFSEQVTLNQDDQVMSVVLSRSEPQPEPAPARKPYEPEMVELPGGRYQMGSPESEEGRDDDENQHWVEVGPVLAGKYEVTKGQFAAFVDATGYRTEAERNVGREGCINFKDGSWDWHAGRSWRNPGFKQSRNEPVVCVSWSDTQAFIEWLNKETGKRYRLPTEAEWEYAARASTDAARYWGNDSKQACKYANAADKAAKDAFDGWVTHDCNDGIVYTSAVGSYKPNSFGLHDMLGNVWEWTCSEYDSDYGGSENECQKTIADRASVRGGSWGNKPARVRSANRDGSKPHDRGSDMGFRLIQDRF